MDLADVYAAARSSAPHFRPRDLCRADTALASARAALSSAPRLALALMSSSRVRIPMTLSLAFVSLQGLDAVASPSKLTAAGWVPSRPCSGSHILAVGRPKAMMTVSAFACGRLTLFPIHFPLQPVRKAQERS